jgi:HTH-type transcriptional regulator / antitoxin MqsA
MKCPACGAAELVHDTRDTPYVYKGESTTLPTVNGDFCPACREGVLDIKESHRVNSLMRSLNRQINSATISASTKSKKTIFNGNNDKGAVSE